MKEIWPRDRMKENNNIFIIPDKKNLENVAILGLLWRNGFKPIVTKKEKWEELEPKTKNLLKEKTDIKNRDDVEIIWTEKWRITRAVSVGGMGASCPDKTIMKGTYKEYKDALKGKGKYKRNYFVDSERIWIEDIKPEDVKVNIYGIALQGENPYGAQNIDFRNYGDEDRTSPLSSLEQIAEIIGVELNEEERLISAYSKGQYPELKKEMENILGKPKNAKQALKQNELCNLLQRKASIAEGLTLEDEEKAEEAIKRIEKLEDYDLKIVHYDGENISLILEKLKDNYNNLLIVSKNENYSFYGRSEVCESLLKEFSGQTGNTKDLENTFWSVTKSNGKEVNKNYPILEEFVLDNVKRTLDKVAPEKEERISFFKNFIGHDDR